MRFFESYKRLTNWDIRQAHSSEVPIPICLKSEQVAIINAVRECHVIFLVLLGELLFQCENVTKNQTKFTHLFILYWLLNCNANVPEAMHTPVVKLCKIKQHTNLCLAGTLLAYL